jgi:NADH-quinone oxidoreductase subunit N
LNLALFSPAQLWYQTPLLVLALGGIAVLLLGAFAKNVMHRWLMELSFGVALIALLFAVLVFRSLGAERVPLYGGMLVADRFALFSTMVFLVATLLSLLVAEDWLEEHDVRIGELYPLMLFSVCGMILLAMAADLVSVFLGLETMSLAVYVLVGSFRKSRRSQEGAMKYFLNGAFATAIFVYGLALVYGVTGSTSFAAIGASTGKGQPLFLAGEVLLVVAFGFKIAAVPFHMWAPDAYEGAPTPVTAFMAAGVKAAAFTAFLRVLQTAFGGDVLPYGPSGWGSLLSVLAAMTMILGNVAALRQENVKRLLAYSSISHAGYLLVGVVAMGVGAPGTAIPAILFYLLAYTFSTVGAFGVIAWLGRRGDERLLLDDWAGLASRHPAAALCMTVFLLSLGGIPPFAGFFGKFYVFRAAMQAWNGQLLWLVVVAVLSSLASVYYYLRVIMAMYFREVSREPQPRRSAAQAVALLVAAMFVLEMGVFPGWWLELAQSAGLP